MLCSQRYINIRVENIYVKCNVDKGIWQKRVEEGGKGNFPDTKI